MYRIERRIILVTTTIWLAFLVTVWLRTLPSNNNTAQLPSAPKKLISGGLGAARHPSHLSNQRPLWWHAPFLSGGGYSTEAVEFVLGLHRSGLVAPGRLWLSQHGDLESPEVLQGMNPEAQSDLMGMLALGMMEPAMTSRDAIIICHSVPGAWSLPEPLFQASRCPPYPLEQAAYVIGRTMFESDSLPPDHVERCNMMDEVWVPTEFHRELYRRCGVDRPQLVVVPEPVDTRAFDPAKHTALPLPIGQRVFGRKRGPAPAPAGAQQEAQGPFVFLSIFKWEERKGWDVLLRAYLEEFGPREEVLLLLLTKPFYSGSDFKGKMRAWAAERLPSLPARGSSGGEGVDWAALPGVYVQHKHLPQQSLPRLYKAAGAFVLPSRGEGWGRPHVEAMSMGLPVLATNWSGPTAFLDESVGYPIKVEALVEAGPNEGPFSGRRWAQPSVAHLRQLMRRVVAARGEAAARGAAARRRMVERYAPEVVAELVAARLREVEGLLARGPAPGRKSPQQRRQRRRRQT